VVYRLTASSAPDISGKGSRSTAFAGWIRGRPIEGSTANVILLCAVERFWRRGQLAS